MAADTAAPPEMEKYEGGLPQISDETCSKKSQHDPKVVEEWTRQQMEMRRKSLILEDAVDWYNPSRDDPFDDLHYIGGVDISFIKDDQDHACASLVVLSFPELEVKYQCFQIVHLSQPYIPEFLAFREVPFLVEIINNLKKTQPELTPQVIFVDGNGVLHPRGFGHACHLGVCVDIATIGVAKKLFQFDGLEKNADHLQKINMDLKQEGDTFPLIGNSGTTHGVALRSTKNSTKPVYVSVGHRLSLDTAVQLVKRCCLYRVPEPIRKADTESREYLRQHSEEVEQCKECKNTNSKETLAEDISKNKTEIDNKLSNLQIAD